MGACGVHFFDFGSENRLETIPRRKKEVSMKLLLATFAVRVVIEMISNKRKEKSNKEVNEKNEKVRHPAEFTMR